MSPDDVNGVLPSPCGDDSRLRISLPSVHDYALVEELSFVRREAQAEANLAYEDWGRWPSGEAYAVYLAAQDRADAAQDELADWVRQLAA